MKVVTGISGVFFKAKEAPIVQASDDRAGGVFMGILITFGAIVVATAAMLERKVHSETSMAGPDNPKE